MKNIYLNIQITIADRRKQVFLIQTTMSSAIILNQSNVVNDGWNNKLQYNFPAGSIKCRGSSIALSTINMFNSWFNITSALSNNSYSIIYPTSTGTTTYVVTMPDGYYDFDQLNAYLQNYLVVNNLYLVNSSGQYVYYVQFEVNPTAYGLQLNCLPLPTSLPSGYTNPGSMTFPATTLVPQIVVPATNFSTLVGFTAGTYPPAPQTTLYSVTSNIAPEINPISSVIVLCSIVENRCNTNPTVLSVFSQAVSNGFGNLIQIQNQFPLWIPIRDASYSTFQVSFVDQNYNPIKILDPAITIMLVLKDIV